MNEQHQPFKQKLKPEIYQSNLINNLDKNESRMINSKAILKSNMYTNNNRHTSLDRSKDEDENCYLKQIRLIDLNELNNSRIINYQNKFHYFKMNLCKLILFNLLLLCCLPVNSLTSRLSHLSLSNSNLTLNQLSSFNTYSGAIQIQYQTINETINFTHVAYDSLNGRLYIGAINNLFQLNSDLSVEQQFQTGPVLDSVQCSASDCGQTTGDILLTPNIAKVLLIDSFSQKLIFCGSTKQGSCARHSLSNVSNSEQIVPIPVAANDEHSSTIAIIIAPSSKTTYHHSTTSNSHVMYVAATNSKLGPYRDMIPALCTRSLESGAKLFNVLEKDISEISRLDLEFHLRDYYLVNYVYAFYTDSHIYFATTQPRSASKVNEELGYSSKLARLCLEDTSYNTYAEITLQCVDRNGDDYPLLQTAYLMEAGSDLKRNLEHPDDRILVAVFTKNRDHTNTPGKLK